jgi:hypothetical protein
MSNLLFPVLILLVLPVTILIIQVITAYYGDQKEKLNKVHDKQYESKGSKTYQKVGQDVEIIF